MIRNPSSLPSGLTKPCKEEYLPGSIREVWVLCSEHFLTDPEPGTSGPTSDPIQIEAGAAFELYYFQPNTAFYRRVGSKDGHGTSYDHLVEGKHPGMTPAADQEICKLQDGHYVLILKFWADRPPIFLGSKEGPLEFLSPETTSGRRKTDAASSTWRFFGRSNCRTIYLDPADKIPNEQNLSKPVRKLGLLQDDLQLVQLDGEGSNYGGAQLTPNPAATFYNRITLHDPTGAAGDVDLVDVIWPGGSGATVLTFDWIASIDPADQIMLEAAILGTPSGGIRGAYFSKPDLDSLLKGHDFVTHGNFTTAANSTGRNYYQEWGGTVRTDVGGGIEQEGFEFMITAWVEFGIQKSPEIKATVKKGIKRLKVLAPSIDFVWVDEDYGGQTGSGEYRAGALPRLRDCYTATSYPSGNVARDFGALADTDWYSIAAGSTIDHLSDAAGAQAFMGADNEIVSDPLSPWPGPASANDESHIVECILSIKDGLSVKIQAYYGIPAADPSPGFWRVESGQFLTDLVGFAFNYQGVSFFGAGQVQFGSFVDNRYQIRDLKTDAPVLAPQTTASSSLIAEALALVLEIGEGMKLIQETNFSPAGVEPLIVNEAIAKIAETF